MTKQCPHAVGKTGCSQDAQEPCPKGYFNCKKVVKDKVIRAWAIISGGETYIGTDKNMAKEIDHAAVPCTVHIKASDYEKLRKNK